MSMYGISLIPVKMAKKISYKNKHFLLPSTTLLKMKPCPALMSLLMAQV